MSNQGSPSGTTSPDPGIVEFPPIRPIDPPIHPIPRPVLEVSNFSIALTPQVEERTRRVSVVLTLSVPAAASFSLSFAGGQQFDVQISDPSGKQVYLWSEGRVFSDVAETVDMSGEHTWTADVPYPDSTGPTQTDVLYTFRGYLTPAGAPADPKAFGASIGARFPSTLVMRPFPVEPLTGAS